MDIPDALRVARGTHHSVLTTIRRDGRPALRFPCLALVRHTPRSFVEHLLIPRWSCDLDCLKASYSALNNPMRFGDNEAA